MTTLGCPEWADSVEVVGATVEEGHDGTNTITAVEIDVDGVVHEGTAHSYQLHAGCWLHRLTTAEGERSWVTPT